jgi:hypothetical protein
MQISVLSNGQITGMGNTTIVCCQYFQLKKMLYFNLSLVKIKTRIFSLKILDPMNYNYGLFKESMDPNFRI